MALIHVEYFSQAMAGQTDCYLALPNDAPSLMVQANPNYQRPMKTLMLLHGYSGGAADWVTGSRIREFSTQYNLAVIMPNGRNGFYLDHEATGEGYATLVGEELPEYACKTFGLSSGREDTFIGGLSMGGFGALRTGLKYAHRYGKIFALSSALIVRELKDMTPDMEHPMANYAYYANAFGDLKTAEQRDCNPEVLIKEKLAAGESLPGIFMACGTEDFLLRPNREMHAFLEENGVAHDYRESPGVHDWKFWNEYLEPAIQWLVEE